MSNFGDQLRENLAHRGAEARAATEAKSAQAEAASIGRWTRTTWPSVVVGVFRPLVESLGRSCKRRASLRFAGGRRSGPRPATA